ncbi:MAG: TIGR02281 family clan AA aspartic protease [Hyphomicrobiales bacterium]|uniref:retropepsin-like aspartic protease family protein n=1 Tax=Rhabdaerophilum calidifontis TaxID=2604328 RepID=UPI0012389AE7|nr:TIGR02281 family clan AA aspartic protease [Rhabdaerophilum calidifontis]MCA1952598.1 TIGR02281 family clan AA aspartic protease [Hyphomicrobiales bacterium]MCA1998937.1 TIGR02281 family clan AA aspartic protease [Hyphomicrobiales bacterium]
MGRIVGLALVLAAFFAGAGLVLGDRLAEPGTVPAAGTVVQASAPVVAGSRVVALRGDNRGHFQTDAQINGRFVRVLVDTGASIVVLSAEDARAAGLEAPRDAYTARMQTANGEVRAARVRIAELRLQSIVVRDVEAAILPPGALKGTLLGMSFLKRLAGFEMQGGTLVLKQ